MVVSASVGAMVVTTSVGAMVVSTSVGAMVVGGPVVSKKRHAHGTWCSQDS